jgi:hypothetical protein
MICILIVIDSHLHTSIPFNHRQRSHLYSLSRSLCSPVFLSIPSACSETQLLVLLLQLHCSRFLSLFPVMKARSRRRPKKRSLAQQQQTLCLHGSANKENLGPLPIQAIQVSAQTRSKAVVRKLEDTQAQLHETCQQLDEMRHACSVASKQSLLQIAHHDSRIVSLQNQLDQTKYLLCARMGPRPSQQRLGRSLRTAIIS